MERRLVLKTFATGAFSVVAGGSVAKRLGAAFTSERTANSTLGTKVATVAHLPVGGHVAFRAPRSASGGAMTSGILIRSGTSTYHAVTSTCPHLGCPVGYVAQAKEFLCPCHGSAFAVTGALLHGPARTGLGTFVVTVSKGSIYVR